MAQSGRLEGKICLVTGGTRGFGASIVSTFVAQGAKVLVLDLVLPLATQEGYYNPYTISPPPPGQATTTGTSTNSKSAYVVRADITERSCWESALATCEKVLGAAPTVVVNNAGWTYSNKPTLDVEEAEFDRVFSVNVKSIFLSVDVILPRLLREKPEDAVFINIASTAALRPRPGLVWCKFSLSPYILRYFDLTMQCNVVKTGGRQCFEGRSYHCHQGSSSRIRPQQDPFQHSLSRCRKHPPVSPPPPFPFHL